LFFCGVAQLDVSKIVEWKYGKSLRRSTQEAAANGEDHLLQRLPGMNELRRKRGERKMNGLRSTLSGRMWYQR
jgi:hypothetical protein